MRRRTLTWMIGGTGLIACGVIVMIRSSTFWMPPTGLILSVLADVLWATSILLFAVGLDRNASVVARRPLGLVATAIVGIWPLTSTILGWTAMDVITSSDAGTAWFAVGIVVPLAAGLISAVQIARAGTVPTPWNRVPLWALASQVVLGAIPQLAAVALGPDIAVFADMLVLLGTLVPLVGTLGLGIPAVVLAARTQGATIEIFRSAPPA